MSSGLGPKEVSLFMCPDKALSGPCEMDFLHSSLVIEQCMAPSSSSPPPFTAYSLEGETVQRCNFLSLGL